MQEATFDAISKHQKAWLILLWIVAMTGVVCTAWLLVAFFSGAMTQPILIIAELIGLDMQPPSEDGLLYYPNIVLWYVLSLCILLLPCGIAGVIANEGTYITLLGFSGYLDERKRQKLKREKEEKRKEYKRLRRLAQQSGKHKRGGIFYFLFGLWVGWLFI